MELDRRATDNLVYLVCIDYENGVSQKELIDKYDRSRNTIRDYLKKGTAFGWCNYDPEKNTKEAHRKSGDWVVKTMSKQILQIDPNTEKIVNEYPSIQEAQRTLGISHIWDCIVGRRKSAGGFIWEYK